MSEGATMASLRGDKPLRLVVLTEGRTEPVGAKTAACLIRYGRDEVVALLDSTQAGKTTQELLGIGGDTPVVARLDDAPQADALAIGIAPSGGRVPPAWREVLLEAVGKGLHLISGLHEFLSEDEQIASAAVASGSVILDVRKNKERDVASFADLRPDCTRVLTVGQDCSVGKMLVSVELARALGQQGHDAKFIATGQTGILVEGDGCPIDCVVSDFVNGAVEKMVVANQHHDFLMVEGQGAIVHPRYSPVTLGLLHGSRPQGMILCYEAGREHVMGMPGVALQPLAKLRDTYEMVAGLLGPTRVIGVGMNSRRLSPEAAEEERRRVSDELGLPVCDVIRDGPQVLVDAILELQSELKKS